MASPCKRAVVDHAKDKQGQDCCNGLCSKDKMVNRAQAQDTAWALGQNKFNDSSHNLKDGDKSNQY